MLKDARDRAPDVYLCLGDVVGYGPEPGECVDALRSLGALCVQGNHEAALLGLPVQGGFSESAQQTLEYARNVLQADQRSYLQTARASISLEGRVLAVHGSPQDRDEYVQSDLRRQQVIDLAGHPLCACGHTHEQFLYGSGRRWHEAGILYELARQERYLVNPGSVGQPRDGDSRAAYAFVDSDCWTIALLRVRYDVERTVRRILEAGLPLRYGERLRRGR